MKNISSSYPKWMPLCKPYEDQYMDIVDNIMSFGTEEFNSRTKTTTKRLPHQVIKINVGLQGIPQLHSKQTDFSWPIREIMWIMQQQSNNTKDLGISIWDKWADPITHEIGCAYGSIVKLYKQMDTLIYKIKNDPSDRGMILNLWDCLHLHEMHSRPCCCFTDWSVIDGYLNCHLTQRSADMMVGVPYDTTGHAALLVFLAKATGTKPGLLTQELVDAHIYQQHYENAYVQLERWSILQDIKDGRSIAVTPLLLKSLKCEGLTYKDFENAALVEHNTWLNPHINDFYAINDRTDIKRNNYYSLPKLEFAVIK